MIIFDLDYTLLDTEKLKQSIADFLNVDYNVYFKTAKESFAKKSKAYSIKEHFKILGKADRFEESNQVFKDLDRFLFYNVEKLLKYLYLDNDLILLTYGDREYQKLKVDNLSIKKYFKEIVYTEESKIIRVNNFVKKNKDIIFINDNAQECKEIKINNNNVAIYLVKGPYSQNCDHDFKEYTIEDLCNLFIK